MKKVKWSPKVVLKSPEELIPYSKNAKVHSKEQISRIAGAISEFGFTQPIVVDKDGVIVAGHGRREAAIALGLKAVPIVVADHLDENQIMAARIADNKVSEAPWNQDFLKFELTTLKLKDFKVELTGFDIKEIDSFLEEGELRSENFNNTKEVKDDEVHEAAPVIEPEIKEEKQIDTSSLLESQFIISINLNNENEMQALFEELSERGYSCKLIT